MAQHESLALSTGMRIFFADPHSRWQRGSNENTNGLLRQYFPKGTSLSGFDQDDLGTVAPERSTSKDARLRDTERAVQ
jgi:IS30 family transposase